MVLCFACGSGGRVFERARVGGGCRVFVVCVLQVSRGGVVRMFGCMRAATRSACMQTVLGAAAAVFAAGADAPGRAVAGEEDTCRAAAYLVFGCARLCRGLLRHARLNQFCPQRGPARFFGWLRKHCCYLQSRLGLVSYRSRDLATCNTLEASKHFNRRKSQC